MRFVTTTVLAVGLITANALAAPKNNLPIIDLGYELHQALSYNTTTDIYVFSNIRYAQPPTGNLRFRAPLPPKTDRSTIQTGSEIRTCPQGVPDWQSNAFIPISRFSNGVPFTLEAWEAAINSSTPFPQSVFNGNVTEDCLFLDVHVPGEILRSAQGDKRAEAPVLVWIHGGGYTLSSKIGHPTPGFHPTGLLSHSRSLGKPMIFISLNYRLGALGFLSGPSSSVTPNTGLLDQLAALAWVKTHIPSFGGSREDISVMGESAGGGAILAHIAAMASRGETPPFAKAIIQSPAMMPLPGLDLSEMEEPESYKEFLKELGVEGKGIDGAREANTQDVIRANQEIIRRAKGINYVFTPVVDGKTVVSTMGDAFKARGVAGKKSRVKIMLGHGAREGAVFFDPRVKTEEDFAQWLKWSFSSTGLLSESQVKELMTEIYPPVFDGSYGYTGQGSRQMALWGEGVLDCNYLWVAEAMGGDVYAYEFGSPGIHTQDLKYTFNDPANPAFHKNMQEIMQTALTSFVVNGKPVSQKGDAPWPKWGHDQTLVTLNETGSGLDRNSVNATRCKWWQDRRA